MQLIITQQLAQATVDYLQQQPYKEVAGLISQFTRLGPYEEPKVETGKGEGGAMPTETPVGKTSDNGASAELSESVPEKDA